MEFSFWESPCLTFHSLRHYRILLQRCFPEDPWIPHRILEPLIPLLIRNHDHWDLLHDFLRPRNRLHHC